MLLRQATRGDIPAMHRIRMSVAQNRLESTGIAESDYVPAIEPPGRGWVIEVQGEIVAFAVGNAANGNIWALFVHPAHERYGHGRRLHDTVVEWLSSQGVTRLWLGTEAGTRAEGFYRTAGWHLVGRQANGELRFERSTRLRVRLERADDVRAIRAVNLEAFETSLEADLVDALRERAEPILSLVADEEGTIAGHILFSPVSLPGDAEARIMGLAPMAVLPARQRQGIGSALVRDGLARCNERGYEAVVVLGHPEYYPRFGFVRASRFGIGCEYDVPDEVFMALELVPGALRGKPGTIRYHPAFAELGSG